MNSSCSDTLLFAAHKWPMPKPSQVVETWEIWIQNPRELPSFQYKILQHACPNPSPASKIEHWKLQQLEEWAKSILKKVKGLLGTHIMVLENLLRGYLLVHSSPCLQQQWFWKFFMERNSISALHGQVTFSILILQDCDVGLLFALLLV